MTLKYFWPVLAQALENVSSVYQKTKMFIKIHVYIPAFISVSGTSRRNTSESHFRPLSRQDFFPLQTYFFCRLVCPCFIPPSTLLTLSEAINRGLSSAQAKANV